MIRAHARCASPQRLPRAARSKSRQRRDSASRSPGLLRPQRDADSPAWRAQAVATLYDHVATSIAFTSVHRAIASPSATSAGGQWLPARCEAGAARRLDVVRPRSACGLNRDIGESIPPRPRGVARAASPCPGQACRAIVGARRTEPRGRLHFCGTGEPLPLPS